MDVTGPDRRTVLRAGGLAAVSPLVAALLGRTPAAAAPGATPAPAAAPAASWPALSPSSLWYDSAATAWETEALPLGNGRVGAMMFGGPTDERIHLNEISLWGGVNNYDNALAGEPDGAYDTSVTGFSSFRNFGNLHVRFGDAAPTVSSPGGPYDTSSNETAQATIDGRADTKWCVIDPPATVQWQTELSTPVAVKSFSMVSANDVPERNPRQWTLEGSADGTSWVTVDERTLPGPFEQRGQRRTFTVASPAAHRWYRFTFVSTPGVSHFQVAEIALDGVDLAGTALMYVSSPSGHGDGRAPAVDLGRSVDGSAVSYWSAPTTGAEVVWQARLSSTRSRATDNRASRAHLVPAHQLEPPTAGRSGRLDVVRLAGRHQLGRAGPAGTGQGVPGRRHGRHPDHHRRDRLRLVPRHDHPGRRGRPGRPVRGGTVRRRPRRGRELGGAGVPPGSWAACCC